MSRSTWVSSLGREVSSLRGQEGPSAIERKALNVRVLLLGSFCFPFIANCRRRRLKLQVSPLPASAVVFRVLLASLEAVLTGPPWPLPLSSPCAVCSSSRREIGMDAPEAESPLRRVGLGTSVSQCCLFFLSTHVYMSTMHKSVGRLWIQS